MQRHPAVWGGAPTLKHAEIHIWFATPTGLVSRSMGFFYDSWGCTYPYGEPYRCLHYYEEDHRVWDYDTDAFYPVVMLRPAALSDPLPSNIWSPPRPLALTHCA